jgi:hypothetical protein
VRDEKEIFAGKASGKRRNVACDALAELGSGFDGDGGLEWRVGRVDARGGGLADGFDGRERNDWLGHILDVEKLMKARLNKNGQIKHLSHLLCSFTSPCKRRRQNNVNVFISLKIKPQIRRLIKPTLRQRGVMWIFCRVFPFGVHLEGKNGQDQRKKKPRKNATRSIRSPCLAKKMDCKKSACLASPTREERRSAQRRGESDASCGECGVCSVGGSVEGSDAPVMAARMAWMGEGTRRSTGEESGG